MTQHINLHISNDELKILAGIVDGEVVDYEEAARRLGLSRIDVAQGVVRYVLSPDYESDFAQVLTDLGLNLLDVTHAAAVLDAAESDLGELELPETSAPPSGTPATHQHPSYFQSLFEHIGPLFEPRVAADTELLNFMRILSTHVEICRAIQRREGDIRSVLGAVKLDWLLCRMARIIDSQPDLRCLGSIAEQMVEVLLRCCVLVADRDRLGPSLLRMYDRVVRGLGIWARVGHHVKLRESLSRALIINQPYRTVPTGDTYLDEQVRPHLEEAWYSLLEAVENEVLSGDEHVGLLGVLNLDPPDEPDFRALSRALNGFVLTLSSGPVEIKGLRLEEIVKRTRMHYSAIPELLDVRLLEIAWDMRWPTWVGRYLPLRWIKATEGTNEIIAWSPLVDELFKTETLEILETHDGFIKIRITSPNFEILNVIGEQFDKALRGNPHRSRRSILGTLKLTLIDLELRLPVHERGIVTDLRKIIHENQFTAWQSSDLHRLPIRHEVIRKFENLAASTESQNINYYKKIISELFM